MIELQNKGAHNINLVTPTHVSFWILKALDCAIEQGLHIPIVYNTGGYERTEIIRMLDGIIDIYMPDAKYGIDDTAVQYSSAPEYVLYNQSAIKINEQGVAQRGLLIRHLILPQGIAHSDEVFRFIANEVDKNTYISLMAQYHPAYPSAQYEALNRRITKNEYNKVLQQLGKYKLNNGWQQML